MYEKSALRKLIKERIKSISKLEYSKQSELLVQRLIEHPRFNHARVVLSFYPLPDEVDVSPIAAKYNNTRTILLPVVSDGELLLKPYTAFENLKKGAYNILEPQGELYERFEGIDLIIVPGLAFSKKMQRLGRGKGYYDRLLSRNELKDAYKIGVGFDFQLLEDIPTERHDIAMDEVLSPSFHYFNNRY